MIERRSLLRGAALGSLAWLLPGCKADAPAPGKSPLDTGPIAVESLGALLVELLAGSSLESRVMPILYEIEGVRVSYEQARPGYAAVLATVCNRVVLPFATVTKGLVAEAALTEDRVQALFAEQAEAAGAGLAALAAILPTVESELSAFEAGGGVTEAELALMQAEVVERRAAFLAFAEEKGARAYAEPLLLWLKENDQRLWQGDVRSFYDDAADWLSIAQVAQEADAAGLSKGTGAAADLPTCGLGNAFMFWGSLLGIGGSLITLATLGAMSLALLPLIGIVLLALLAIAVAVYTIYQETVNCLCATATGGGR